MSGSSGRTRAVVAIGVAVAALAGAGITAWVLTRGAPGAADLEPDLVDLGRVVVVGDTDLLALRASGAELTRERDVAGLTAVLDGRDDAALGARLDTAGVAGIVADGRHGGDASPHASVRRRLGAYGHVEGLRAVRLAPTATLYVRVDDDDTIAPELRHALARVARALIAGARPPRTSSFPEPLRRVRNCEMMVMLRERGRPRLWRSARGSSIARALTTAAVVARSRWMERETSMGGPLDRILPRLDVEVSLLAEDGTLARRSEAFVARVFTPAHGVAYERKGQWRYYLPDQTRERGRGSAVRAYQALFAEFGLPPGSFDRTDLRLYRLVATPLAVSPAGSEDALAPSPAGGGD